MICRTIMVCFSFLLAQPCTSALSAATTQVIQGHVPKLSPALESQVQAKNFSLFKLDHQGNLYDDGNIASLVIDPTHKIADILTSIHPVISQPVDNEAIDQDGDNHLSLQALSSLTMTLEGLTLLDMKYEPINDKFHDKTLCDISLLTETDIRYLPPYMLRVFGDLQLKTKYGIPNTTNYIHEFISRENTWGGIEMVEKRQPSKQYLLSIKPSICYISPSLSDNFTGFSPTIWNPNFGFYQQSVIQPELNFPTTGFDRVFFDLNISGVDATLENWYVSYPSGATNVTAEIVTTSSNTVKITLNGPNRASGGGLFSPTHIKVSNSSKTIEYEFKLQKWFITNKVGLGSGGVTGAHNFCNSLTGQYRLPDRQEYVKSNVFANPINYPAGAGGKYGGNYIRSIGQGVFSEWGNTGAYPLSGWEVYSPLYTSEKWNSVLQYIVGPKSGGISSLSATNLNARSSCVSF